MPCKKKQQQPTKCTPNSRRMLESLTLKDLAEAVAEYLPNSQSPHPIPKSGQYANDRDDCSPGVSCSKCRSHHQKSNKTPQLNESESCVSTCREVSAMNDEIRQCRQTIGALAKEAQQLIITASGMLDVCRCECDKPGQTKQVKIGSYSKVKSLRSINSYGQRMFREKSRERLISCDSCENAAKRRRNQLQQEDTAVGKQSNPNVYPKRQPIRANPTKVKRPDIKNCCQKICGEDCACDEAEIKQQSAVTTTDVDEDKKKRNGNADSKAIAGGTCCDCALRKDVDDSPSNIGMKKQNKVLKKPNVKISRLDKIGKRTNGKDKRNCAERNKCCPKICGDKLKEIRRQTAAADGQIAVDDCACFRIMKKRKKKLSRLERIWQILNERDNKCDCGPKEVDEYGCYDEDGGIKKIRSKSNCKKIKSKVCGKKVTCKCPPMTDDECECYEDMENQDSFLKRKISNCSFQKIRKKVCGQNVTCRCPSQSVDDCQCNEDMENQGSLFKSSITNYCSLENIRVKLWDKGTSCDCGPKSVDDYGCDEDMDRKNKCLEILNCKNGVLKRTWNKVFGKDSCECVADSKIGNQENTEKRTSDKNTSSVFVAAKNKCAKIYKSDYEAESKDTPLSVSKTCQCRYPPAYAQYFECTGQLCDNCQCDTND